jgi:hypothetical protein
MLGEFTLRSTNPLRALVHRLAPWLPEARLFRQRVKVRGAAACSFAAFQLQAPGLKQSLLFDESCTAEAPARCLRV